MKKRIGIFLAACMVVLGLCPGFSQPDKASAAGEVRGLWISYVDFGELGLKNATKAEFQKTIRKVIRKGKKYGINTVYFHARAFDDATWKSKTFKANSYLTSKASAGRTAAETYGYDPLGTVISECHKNGIKVEAWLNPYRITLSLFLDPASSYSTDRINRAVNELKAYSLDGIHFDDYFYHSRSKYITPTKATRYSISVKGKTFKKTPSAAVKRENVNRMVSSVYKNTHKKSGLKFGISPQGNVDNCMGGGCDVKTWMRKSGYVDYIAPQIYWTDQWGRKGNVTMFSDRLALWTSLNKRNVSMIPGLALYKAGTKDKGDRGWERSSTNLRTQVKKIRAAGGEGFILFDSSDLFRASASKELYKLKGLVKPVKAKALSVPKKIKVKVGKTAKIKVTFVPADTNPKSKTFKSSDKKIATVSKKGVVKGVKPGKATITVTAKSGVKAKTKVTVVK